jgi:hypothetical protein
MPTSATIFDHEGISGRTSDFIGNDDRNEAHRTTVENNLRNILEGLETARMK